MLSRKKNKEKNKEAQQVKTNMEILPIRSYDLEIGAFVMEDHTYMDVLNVVPSDRDNLQGDELQYNIMINTRFYRLYAPDGKFISMNFPMNTAVQRAYFERKLSKTHDVVRQRWIEREIHELEILDQNVMRREFYLMFFGESKEDFLKNKNSILRTIGFGRSKLVEDIETEKKIQIIRKICNMNSLILPDDLKEVNDEKEKEE